MNSQEYRNLQEAYLDVYQEEVLDELHRGRHGQTETEYMDSRSDAGKQISGDSKTSGAAYSHRSYKGVGKPAKPGERQETQGKMDTNTRTDILYRKAARLKKEELSLDERVLGQDPEMRRARTKDEKRLPPSAGTGYAANQKKSISYMNKLTKNNKIIPGMAHESYDQQLDEISIGMKRRAADASVDKVKRAGERFRSSTSVDVQPYLMKKKDEAEAQHLRLAKAAESYDLFDYIMEYLITEGYADTNENALVIMANMSEDWRQSIVNEGKSSRPRYPGGRGVLDQETRDEKREASAENMRGHTEGPGTVTKNPKKLRKQSAMNEFGR